MSQRNISSVSHFGQIEVHFRPHMHSMCWMSKLLFVYQEAYPRPGKHALGEHFKLQVCSCTQ